MSPPNVLPNFFLSKLSDRAKKMQDIGRALQLQRWMRSHDHFTRSQIEVLQKERLAALVRHAVAHSSYYRQLYRGIDTTRDIQLEALPTITKTAMMQNFDAFVTRKELRLDELLRHAETITDDSYYLGEFRVLTTGGSSGQKGVFVYDRPEWSVVQASVLRWGDFVGVKPRVFPRRMRVCAIGGNNPMHGTYRAAASLDFGLHRVLRLNAISSIASLVQELNNYQPDVINAYPSIAALLAQEQLEGRLRISPLAVSTSSEVRTPEMAQRIQEAWGIQPFNYYGMTESVSFGVECSQHRGIHAFEDTILFEIVDADNRPVPPGTPGQKLLLTNLYNFSQPLIRYEMSDILTLAKEPCPCGRPLRLIADIDGRADEVMYFTDAAGSTLIPVHPTHVRTCIGAMREVREYQVVQRGDSLTLNIVLCGDYEKAAIARRLDAGIGTSVSALGAVKPEVRVEFLDLIPRDPKLMGKFRVIHSDPARRPPKQPT